MNILIRGLIRFERGVWPQIAPLVWLLVAAFVVAALTSHA